jgi:hypothetical protein
MWLPYKMNLNINTYIKPEIHNMIISIRKQSGFVYSVYLYSHVETISVYTISIL